MSPRRRAPVTPAVEVAGGLDAAELRRRIQQHLDQHAAAGDIAAMAVEEVVLHADTGKVTVQQERVVVKPRFSLRPSRLPDLAITGAGERMLGLPVEWYFRLVWPYAVFGAVIIAVIAWWGGNASDLLRLLVAIGIGVSVGIASGRHGVNLGQSAIVGVTAGAAAGLIASLLVLVTTWTLGSFLNIIVLPAYLAFVGAILAPAAAFAWRWWQGRK